MEQPRSELADFRATVSQLASEIGDMRQEFRTDIRRLDDRLFQLMLLQLGTIATALVGIVVALVS